MEMQYEERKGGKLRKHSEERLFWKVQWVRGRKKRLSICVKFQVSQFTSGLSPE